MRVKRVIRGMVVVGVMMGWAPLAHAWTCNSPGQVWVQVPSGTHGGQVEVIEGLTFQCQTPPASGGVRVQQDQDQSQAQGQLQAQTTQSDADASSSAASSATLSDSGNNSNNINFQSPKFPVSTAYAPSAQATVSCFKGVGVGVQTMIFGGSFGGGKVDEGCDERELARSYFLAGSRLAGCKLLVSNKRSQKAGVTLADCLESEPVPIISAPYYTSEIQPIQPAPQPIVITVEPAPVIIQPAPVPVAPIVVPAPVKPPVVRKRVVAPPKPKVKDCDCNEKGVK